MKSERNKSLRMFVGAAITVFAAVAPLTPAAAAILPAKDSSLFAHQSEMNTGGDLDANANTTNWTLVFGGGTASLSGGLLTMDTTPANNREWTATAWPGATSAATGWTLEFSVHVVSSGTDDLSLDRAFQIYAGDDADTINLHIGTNGTYYSASATPIDANLNTDGFHVFRIAKEAGAHVFYVWRDGVLLSNTIPTGGPDHSMYFGDGTGSLSGSGEFDYVRWDATGAFQAPEPASLSLLAAGGLLVLRRRR